MILKFGKNISGNRKNQMYLIAIPSQILEQVGLPYRDGDCLYAFTRRKLTAARIRYDDLALSEDELQEVTMLLQNPDYNWTSDQLRAELAKLWLKIRHWEKRADELMTEKSLIGQNLDKETDRYEGMVADRDKWQGLASDWQDKIDVLEGQYASLVSENNRMDGVEELKRKPMLTEEGKRVAEGLNTELTGKVVRAELAIKAVSAMLEQQREINMDLMDNEKTIEATIVSLRDSVTEQTDNFYTMRNDRDVQAEKASFAENQLVQERAKSFELTSSNLRRGEKIAEDNKRHNEVVHEMVVRREYLEGKLETAKNTIKKRDDQHANLQTELADTETKVTKLIENNERQASMLKSADHKNDESERQITAYQTDVKLHEEVLKRTSDELNIWRPFNRWEAFGRIFKMTWTTILGVPKSKNRIG